MNLEKKKKRNGRDVMMVEGEILRQILIRLKNSEKDIIAENRLEKAKLESPKVV